MPPDPPAPQPTPTRYGGSVSAQATYQFTYLAQNGQSVFEG